MALVVGGVDLCAQVVEALSHAVQAREVVGVRLRGESLDVSTVDPLIEVGSHLGQRQYRA